MRLDQFTVKAQEALTSAQTLAEKSDHPEVTSEHLLKTLLEHEGGVVPAALGKLGVALEQVEHFQPGEVHATWEISRNLVEQIQVFSGIYRPAHCAVILGMVHMQDTEALGVFVEEGHHVLALVFLLGFFPGGFQALEGAQL